MFPHKVHPRETPSNPRQRVRRQCNRESRAVTRIAGFPVQKIRELMAAILMCGMVDALVTSTTSVRDVSRLRFARSLTAQFTPLEDAAEARGVYIPARLAESGVN